MFWHALPNCVWIFFLCFAGDLFAFQVSSTSSTRFFVSSAAAHQQRYQQKYQQPQHGPRYGHPNNRNSISSDIDNNDSSSGNYNNNNNNNNNNHNNNIHRRNKQAVSRAHDYQQPSESLGAQNSRAGLQPPSVALAERNPNKCPIWVPIDASEKYAWARKIQVDQSNQVQLIEICCRGFAPVRWRGNTLCRPLCDNCRNGYCVAPGVCECYEEFVKSDNGDCVFTCPLGCLNGRCYLDGSCQCDAGYKLDESRKFCRPICSAGCGQNPRHNCTAPEVCGCTKGYQLTDSGCQPTCSPDCGVGGSCREHNTCECGLGYTFRDGACQSECYQKCDNGICYGRNRCICNPGYTYHEKSTQCIPA